jgi:hypothetical protein
MGIGVTEATMPNIGRSGHVSGQKCLRQRCGRRLGKDIKAVFTSTGKKNFLGDEILDMENRRVKLKKDIIFTTKLLNR